MFFKELFKMFQKSDLLTQAVNDAHEMIEISYDLYKNVVEMLLKPNPKFNCEDVAKEDFLLNHFEKSIRRKAYEHISINDKEDQNLYTAVILLTIVSNIERLGDYCKNICDMSAYKAKMVNADLNTKITELSAKIDLSYNNTIKAFKETDPVLAEKVIDDHYRIKLEVDSILDDLIGRDTQTGENVVVYALSFRFMKSISAHLMNIASSITNPIDKIGHYVKNDQEKDDE